MGFIFEFFKGIVGISLIVAVLAGVGSAVALAGFLTGAFIDILVAIFTAVFDGGLFPDAEIVPDDATGTL